MVSKKRIPLLLIVFGSFMICAGILIASKQDRQNLGTARQSASASNAAPSTFKPTENDFDNYKVAPSLPRYIYIPSINVKAVVRPLGLVNTNQIDAPTSVFDVGWFNQSSKPGKDGAMVVDGHVSSKSTKGIFYNIKSLEPGQPIVIEKGDGTRVTYSVSGQRLYDAANVDMAAVLSPINPNKPGLNLITCAGSVVNGTNEFNKRIVVFAELQ